MAVPLAVYSAALLVDHLVGAKAVRSDGEMAVSRADLLVALKVGELVDDWVV